MLSEIKPRHPVANRRNNWGIRNLLKIKIILLAFIGALLSACSSTNPYYIDRQRDALDIFSLTAEPGFGAKARVGPIGTGLLFNGCSYGLRSGEVVNIGDEKKSADWQMGVLGLEGYAGTELSKLRNKTYGADNVLGINIAYLNREDEKTENNTYQFYTQIYAVACVFWGIRIGFNPGELVDFCLGWFEIDVFDDDIGIYDKKENNNAAPFNSD